MTDMMSGVESAKDSMPATGLDGLDEQLVAQRLSSAKASGLKLTGEGGVLQQLTKRLLESAFEARSPDHLGYDKHDPADCGTDNSRNGTRSKTALTDVGPVQVDVPRDRDASFEPKIVAKWQKRLGRGRRDGDLLGRQGDHRRDLRAIRTSRATVIGRVFSGSDCVTDVLPELRIDSTPWIGPSVDVVGGREVDGGQALDAWPPVPTRS